MTTTQTAVLYTEYESPVGPILLTADEEGAQLTGLYFKNGRFPPTIEVNWTKASDAPALLETTRQLDAYFSGERCTFNLPLAPTGTDFQRKVWAELQNIGYGETVSYGELARRIGDAKAVRAVGLANGRNPISLIVPCHRVIGANGKLVGYGGGMERKEALLNWEKAVRTGGPHPLSPMQQTKASNLFDE